MLEIVKLKNPFDRTRRETERVAFVPGQVLTEYIPDQKVVFVLNGNFAEQPELTFPCDGDQIIVLPHVGHGGFKGILGMIASIALSVYVGNVAAGKWGGIFARGTLGAFLASGAVMYVGGRIINAVFPVQQKGLNLGQPSSPTYGWDTPQPVTGEGGAIGITYGECVPAPQVLERHVETVNGKQYLNLLLCGGIGPVDSIANIKIGSTPIENFQGVQIETRLGTNDQTPISFFTDTPLDQAVGLELSEAGLIQTSDSAKAVSLEVTAEFPGGLYHVKDNGSLENTTVVIRLEYRLSGTANWTYWQDWSITAAQNTAVRQSTRIWGLTQGQYEVRATIISRNTDSRYSTMCSWTVLTAYNPGQYARPNKVLVGLRILATNQLSGSIPDVTWRQVRNAVYVWNPQAQRYEAKSARNPIWAAYDIYHQCRYMKNSNTGQYEYVVFGVGKNRLSAHWDEWVEAATYADEQVAGLDGTPEHRFEFDAFYDIEQKRYDAAQKAANVGHAVIIPRGNNIGIKCDKPGQMVQIFGEGRTTLSSLNGTFTGTKDRALAVEVVYTEQNNDFKNTQFLIRSPQWNTATEVQDNPAERQLFGVKRRSQAYREGVYTLANNELVTQFIDIDTDIDALVCEYGDLVGLNHTVPQIGIKSGRLVAATMNTVMLDSPVDILAGLSYELKLQLADDSIITKKIVSVSEDITTDTLTVTAPFTKVPQQYDNYVFGETGKSVKPFRLVGIEKDGDLRCKLSLAEYVKGVYSGDLNYPIVDYTPPGSKIFEISNLSLAEENYRTKQGINISLLHISWDIQRNQQADLFYVYYSTDGLSWKFWEQTFNMTSTIDGIIPRQTYWVKVCVVKEPLQSTGVVTSRYITGIDALPPDVEGLSVTQSGTKLIVTVSTVDVADFNYYDLRMGPNWSQAIKIDTFVGVRYEFDAPQEGTLTFWVRAVDNAGNYSAEATKATINVFGLPPKNIIFERQEDLSQFIATDMYLDPWGIWKIDDKRIIGDFAYFSDIFNAGVSCKDNPELILPVIDLGPNIIEDGYYYIDPWGNIEIKEKISISELTHFSDMFSGPFELEQVKYIAETFVSIDITYNQSNNNQITIEYCTSIDGSVWGDWKSSINKQFFGRYVKIRLLPKSLDAITNVEISAVKTMIDVPDVEDIIENVSIPAVKTRIKFKRKFYATPKSVALFTADLTGKQATWRLSNVTNDGFDLELLDDNGNLMAGILQKADIRGY